MAARIAAALALVALADGCGGGGGRPHFTAASGWHKITEPGQIVSAANVRFAAADRSQSAPIHTVAALPKRGILIWVQSSRRGKRRSVPLRVQNMAPARPDGFTPPGATGSLQSWGKRWNVYVWVFFGTARPSRAAIAAANAELARLSF